MFLKPQKAILTGVILLASASLGISQSTAEGVLISNNPNAVIDDDAILDVQAADKGMLIPRMTEANRNQIPDVQGMLVYQSNTTGTSNEGFYYNDGNGWHRLATGANTYWTPNGSDIYFNTGKVGVGTNSPSAELSVYGPATVSGGQNLVQVNDMNRTDFLQVANIRTTGTDGELIVYGSENSPTPGNGRIKVVRGNYGMAMQTALSGSDPGFVPAGLATNLRVGGGFTALSPATSGTEELGTTNARWGNLHTEEATVNQRVTFTDNNYSGPRIHHTLGHPLRIQSDYNAQNNNTAIQVTNPNELSTGHYVSIGSATNPGHFRVGPDGRTAINLNSANSPLFAMLGIKAKSGIDAVRIHEAGSGNRMLIVNEFGNLGIGNDNPTADLFIRRSSTQNEPYFQARNEGNSIIADLSANTTDGTTFELQGTGSGTVQFAISQFSRGLEMRTNIESYNPGFVGTDQTTGLVLGDKLEALYPLTSGNKDLGKSTHEWADLYAQRGTYSDRIIFTSGVANPNIEHTSTAVGFLTDVTYVPTGFGSSVYMRTGSVINHYRGDYFRVGADVAGSEALFRVSKDGRVAINIPHNSESYAMLQIKGVAPDAGKNELVRIKDHNNDYVMRISETGETGIRTTAPEVALDLKDAGAYGGIRLPIVNPNDNTLEVISNPVEGVIIYATQTNSTLGIDTANQFYGYTANGWKPLSF